MRYFKKILLLFFVTILFLFSAKIAKAQSFKCEWFYWKNDGAGACEYDIGYHEVGCFVPPNEGAERDWETDKALCSAIDNETDCVAVYSPCTWIGVEPEEPEPEEPPPPTGPNKYYCQTNSAKNGCELAEKSNSCDAANGYAPGDLCPSVPYEFCDEAAVSGLDCVYTGTPGCGEINQPCCPNTGCNDTTNSVCNLTTGICEACGKKGQTCCQAVHPCGQGGDLYCTGNNVCEKLPNTNPTKPKANTTCGGKDGIETAIGCIPIGDPGDMAIFLMNWALGIGGGISFLLIVFAGFQIMTSGGDPKKLQGGKELLTAAIGGIILLVFSSFLLRTLGFNILGIF